MTCLIELANLDENDRVMVVVYEFPDGFAKLAGSLIRLKGDFIRLRRSRFRYQRQRFRIMI